MFNKIKFSFLQSATKLILLLVIALSPLLPVAKVQAECSVSIRMEHFPNGQGPPQIHYVAGTVSVSSNDILTLHYEIIGCVSFISSRPYLVQVSAGSSFTTAEIARGDMSADIRVDKNVPKPTSDIKLIYSIYLYKDNGQPRVVDQQSEVTITYKVNTSTTTGESNYTPTDIKVCKTGEESVKVNWKTKSPANSAINYHKDGAPVIEKGFTNYNLTTHSIPLAQLGKSTHYVYQVGGAPSAGAAYVLSGIGEFTTGAETPGCKADGTPDPTTTTTNTNTTTPPVNVNTGVGVTLGNLDEPLGFFQNPLTFDTLPELLASILRILFILIGIVAVIVIIIAGFRMVASSGNEAALAKAKAAITWAIVGLIVSLMSFSIVAIVQRLIQGS